MQARKTKKTSTNAPSRPYMQGGHHTYRSVVFIYENNTYRRPIFWSGAALVGFARGGMSDLAPHCKECGDATGESLAARDLMRARGGLDWQMPTSYPIRCNQIPWHDATGLLLQEPPCYKARCHRPAPSRATELLGTMPLSCPQQRKCHGRSYRLTRTMQRASSSPP